MEQQKLEKLEKILKLSFEISESKSANAIYNQITMDYIEQQAVERKVSFDDMLEIIKNKLITN